jgi:nitrite reductase/ring-hydroxylating ferredoxin subunit/uncharacterized membrane protein
MKPLVRETVAERLEGAEALDAVAEPIQSAVGAVLPSGSQAKDILSGTWLGHPLHPPLTDVVVGSWTGALALDLIGEEAADVLVAIGVLSSLPTAAAGVSDWADVRGGARRVGLVHALGNTTALVLNAASLVERRRGRRARGVALSALAFGFAGVSAWLGGHLSFARGVGVNQTAFEASPDDWTRVADADSLEDGPLVRATADELAVLLVRKSGRIHALADRCSHRGCSLADGKLEGSTVVCSCHGSTFALDGSLVKGPATSPQPAFDVRIREGAVEVRSQQGERPESAKAPSSRAAASQRG